MNLSEWSAQIAEWKLKYGVPDHGGPRRFRPDEIKLACAKCKRLRHRMSRHHKANDYMFACLLPDVYAARYIQFLPEDVAKLCERCHKHWHALAKPIVRRVLQESTITRIRGGKITKEWCELWRLEILGRFERWVKVAPPKRRRKNGKRKRRKRETT